jgi:hypothetical protein
MATRLSVTARNTALDALCDLFDAGGAGTIKVYTGTQPASPDAGVTGTLLATLTFTATAFAAASAGVATAAAITSDTSIDATGTAGWARCASGAGTAIMDLSVGVTGGAQQCLFNSVSFIAGGTCAISSFTITCIATYGT